MRHLRKMTWLILLFNLLMLVLVISGVASGSHTSKANCGGLTTSDCTAASHVGTAIGVVILIVLWALGDVILGVLWLVTNRRGRDCPVCGRPVKRGQVQCQKCGHDFRQAPVAQPQLP